MRRFGLALALVFGSFAAACASEPPPVVLPIGAEAPEIAGTTHDGRVIDLVKFKGSTTVVYFYPKDGTPGCTTQACAFRDTWDRFVEADIKIIGVSPDSVETHREFAREHKLPFPLVSDEKRDWMKAFGVDATLGMPDRDSFLIGPDRKLAKVYRGVDPALHAEQVLTDAAQL